MLYRFYNLLFPFAFLCLLPGYLRRMVRRGRYRQNFGQRIGLYSSVVRSRLGKTKNPVWVQAVSVGEMLVALKLLAALRELDPELPLVVSTTTTTGFALAESRVPAGVEVVYTPIDSRGAVRRAFDAIAPTQLVIVDGGLWPNQLHEARRRGVPTALVNARLSPRSEKRFRQFRSAAQLLFGHLDVVGVPEATDVERWTQLGVLSANIQQTGSVKFDDAPSMVPSAEAVDLSSPRLTPNDCLRKIGVPTSANVLLAASTHPGEERIMGEVYQRLRAHFPELFLIVAPRHVERASEVRQQLEEIGLAVTLRTQVNESQRATPDVLLLDTTGELRDWYKVATVAFVGKSLEAVGGQNPVEAVIAGAPVVFGPHMENFAEISTRLLAARAAMEVLGAEGLEVCLTGLLRHPEERSRMIEAARREILVHRGASARTAELLRTQRRNSTCQMG